jgi:hypothetical protein
MDTTRPNTTNAQYVECKPLHDALLPLNPILRPDLSVVYDPETGLSLTGTIAGLKQWYEDDKLQDQEPDWFGLAISVQLTEIVYLYLTRVYAAVRSQDAEDRFYDKSYDLAESPQVDFEKESVSWKLSPEKCAELLETIDAEPCDFDAILASQPAFPPL